MACTKVEEFPLQALVEGTVSGAPSPEQLESHKGGRANIYLRPSQPHAATTAPTSASIAHRPKPSGAISTPTSVEAPVCLIPIQSEPP